MRTTFFEIALKALSEKAAKSAKQSTIQSFRVKAPCQYASFKFTFHIGHLADAFIQSDFQ